MWADWHLLSDAKPMTAGQAQARQDEARARRADLTWFVGPAGGGAVMARAHTLDFQGGELLPGALIAPTLAELRRMMPAGLIRQDRQAGDPQEIIESWWE